MKKCNTCFETKALEDFPIHPEMKDGRRSRCKICENKRICAKRVRKPHPNTKVNPDDPHREKTSWCWYGQHFTDKENFILFKDGRLSALCKPCKKKQRLENIDKFKEYDRRSCEKNRSTKEQKDRIRSLRKKWRNKNKNEINFKNRQNYDPSKNREWMRRRRARKNQIPDTMPKGWWQMMLDFYGSKCAKCGSEDNLSHDHIIPITHPDSSHSLLNSQILCFSCNSSKNNIHHTDYRDWSRGILL